MKRTLLLIPLLLLFSLNLVAQVLPDSIASRRSYIIIPYAFYQQETSVAPGITGGYYFKSNDLSRISSVTGSVIYTFLNQFVFNLTPRMYFDQGKLFVYSNLSIRDYFDYYYGIGNKQTDTKQAFTSQSVAMVVQPQYIVSKYFFVGGTLSVRYERIQSDSTLDANKETLFARYGRYGWNPYSQWSIGALAAYDTRDNQFYPQKGIFAKTTLDVSKAGWGSTYSTKELCLDYRQYVPLFDKQVFAWQFYYKGIYGNKGIPFQLLPTVGGRDMLRGFREGMYRDNVLMMLQTEYRLPIYKRLKGAVFLSAGDVMNSSGYHIDKLKVAYGAGLRYRLNDARVHLRFDLAKNNYGDNLQFYITASEAF